MRTEQELLKKIIIIPLLILFLLAIVLIYFSIQTAKSNIQRNKDEIKSIYIEEKKRYLKSKIDSFISYNQYDIKHKLTTFPKVVKKFNSKTFISKDYIFVYDEVNLSNPKKFARMLINPNRPDLVGHYLSLDVKDSNGFAYRKKMVEKIQKSMLEDIKNKGEAFVEYAYKKPNSDEIAHKISYFRYIPEEKVIIASGVYLDNMNKDIAVRIEKMKERENNYIQIVMFYILISAFVIGLFLYLYVKKIDKIFLEKNKAIEEKNQELAKVNASLEKRIQDAIEEIEKRDEIILQNSRVSTMGEIINMIAHQWRQPLNVLSLILMNLSMKLDMSEEAQKEITKAEATLHKLSAIIDDFRKLFASDNKQREFNLSEVLQNILDILEKECKSHNIEVKSFIEENIYLEINKNDLVQSILNILQNSKEVLLSNNIKNPKIEVKLYKKDNKIFISIKDNGGGVDEKLLEKIFEPYFSTKEKNARGLGMYRTKILIEKNGGEIFVKNGDEGLVTEIRFVL